jgi:hypothetical protein
MNIAEEFEGAELGDKRRGRRLVRLATDLARDPAASFPEASRTEAATEATYRLLRNPHVTPEAILQPHFARTADRARASKHVVVAHDTTEISFPTNRVGLGRVNEQNVANAFFLHTALAIEGAGQRAPLGVIGARRHVRKGPLPRKKSKRSENKPEPQRESRRWWELISEVDRELDGCSSVIHVCDREADQYLLLARCVEAGIRFVIRSRHDRTVCMEDKADITLRRVMKTAEVRLCRVVELTPRAPKLSWIAPSKKGRRAKLEIRASAVTVVRPAKTPMSRFRPPERLRLNVVHVVEIDPPTGFAPVDWMLLTTEPIETAANIAAIVDFYDTRWVIEEYFKALKTGCAVEKRQLESAATIFNAVAIFMPIAVQLLALKHNAAHDPETPATHALPEIHVHLLQLHPDVKLRSTPTVADAWLAIARLGGHLRSNGPPGWQVLWRGMSRLLVLAEGAALAQGLEL